MGVIQMKYREGYCDKEFGILTDYSEQCHTCAADAKGCRYFQYSVRYTINGVETTESSACKHACYKTIYKGISAKNYEMKEHEDPWNPWLNCMLVNIGKRTYECDEVILDGKMIYGGNQCVEEDVEEGVEEDFDPYQGDRDRDTFGEIY